MNKVNIWHLHYLSFSKVFYCFHLEDVTVTPPFQVRVEMAVNDDDTVAHTGKLQPLCLPLLLLFLFNELFGSIHKDVFKPSPFPSAVKHLHEDTSYDNTPACRLFLRKHAVTCWFRSTPWDVVQMTPRCS